MTSRRIWLTFAALLALSPAAAQAQTTPPVPVVIKGPIAPPLAANQGTGLCVASRLSLTMGSEFGAVVDQPGLYNGVINAFLDAADTQGTNPRKERVLQSIFDLSSNNDPVKSNGDFIDAATGGVCPPSGCPFTFNSIGDTFASRFRGYLNVTEALAGKPIHIGFVADDAVSLSFWDKNKGVYSVLTRPPKTGSPSWRTTNTVTFTEAGLYPIEINYLQLAEQAVLEMAYLIDDGSGTFTNGTDVTKDFERPTGVAPVISLKDAQFKLFAPGDFYAALGGQLPFPATPQICAQCDRQFVNQAGPDICVQGYYCNEAALCAPCDSALFCGDTCSPCMGETPFCINVNGKNACVGCTQDSDCKVGSRCDAATHQCQACSDQPSCMSPDGSSGSGSGGSGGGATGGGTPGTGGGCGCGVAGAPRPPVTWLSLGLLLAWRRRPRRAS